MFADAPDDAPDDVPVEALEDAFEEPVAALELLEDVLAELADEPCESVEDVVAELDEPDCDDTAESAPSEDDALAAELATAELLELFPEMGVHAKSPPTSTASRKTSAMRHAFFMESIIPKSAMRYAWHGPLRRYRETGKERRIA